VDTVSRAIERAALAIFNNRKQSGGAVRARGDARAGLEEALNVDEISTIINESLMGYAPGTTDNVRNGTWNARDDEIDTPAIARELRARLLGEEHT
jgi:hypothetical protein